MAPTTFRSGVVALLSLAFTFAGVSAPPTVATAQSTPSSEFRRVIDVQVKPESVSAWGMLHRDEMLPAFRKAGASWVDVWASATGDPYLRTIVTPVDSLASIELAPALEQALGLDVAHRLLERNRQLVNGVNTFIMRARPELGFGSPPARRTVGLLSTVTVYAGRTTEFETLLKSSVLNTLKEINASGFVVLQVVYGGDPNQYRTVLTYDNPKDSGGAEQRDLGLLGHPDPVAWLQQHIPNNVDGLGPHSGSPVASIERTIIRYQPELSFRPPE
jgi:hypothetical protein